jgi:hypothetical protein
MAKKTLEQRKLVREQAAAAIAEQDEEEVVIDPDDDKALTPTKRAVVSFHDTTDGTDEVTEEEKPKSLAKKFAAATFNQGETFVEHFLS